MINDKKGRSEIKKIIEPYLKGLQDFKVVCDESNNPTINQNELVIHMFVKPNPVLDYLRLSEKVKEDMAFYLGDTPVTATEVNEDREKTLEGNPKVLDAEKELMDLVVKMTREQIDSIILRQIGKAPVFKADTIKFSNGWSMDHSEGSRTTFLYKSDGTHIKITKDNLAEVKKLALKNLKTEDYIQYKNFIEKHINDIHS